MNIIEGIQAESNRCRKLIEHYKEIGPVGNFGKAMIELAIKRGEEAIASGDVIACIQAYKELQECE